MNAEPILRRLAAVGWEFRYQHGRSCVLLAREWLRRQALWAAALGLEDTWPMVDIGTALEAPWPSEVVEAWRAQVERDLLPLFVRDTGTLMLRAAVADVPLRLTGLPADPWEPLLRLYERGGAVRTEHGMLQVGLAGIPLRIDRFRGLPPVDIAPADLDQADGMGQ
jgi:hypothetical protein